MSQITVFEAPQEQVIDVSDEEKYVLLAEHVDTNIVDAIRRLDEHTEPLQVDTTIPAILIRDLSKYLYPIWDRYLEQEPKKSKFVIKVPYEQETYGVLMENGTIKKRLLKSSGGIDVIGMYLPKFALPQHRPTEMGPIGEEAFFDSTICDTRYFMNFNSMQKRLISDPYALTGYAAGFLGQDIPLSMAPYVIFTNEADALSILSKTLLELQDHFKVFDNHRSLIMQIAHFSQIQLDTKQPVIDRKPTKTIPTAVKDLQALSPVVYQDLIGYNIVDLPLNERSTFWLSLRSSGMTNYYLARLQDKKAAEKIADEMKETREYESQRLEVRKKLLKFSEIQSIKLALARNKFQKMYPMTITSLGQLTQAHLGVVEQLYVQYEKTADYSPPREVLEFQKLLFGPVHELKAAFQKLKAKIKFTSAAYDLGTPESDEIYATYQICPHRLFMGHALSMGKPHHVVVSEVRDKFTKPDLATNYGFFCMKCGELVQKIDTDTLMSFTPSNEMFIDSVSFGQQSDGSDDQLRNMIRRNTMTILREYVTFQGQANLNTIADYIVAVVYDKVFMMEREVGKSKTSLNEQISDIVTIYSYIYITATVIRMISANKGVIQFVPSLFSTVTGASGGFAYTEIVDYVDAKTTDLTDAKTAAGGAAAISQKKIAKKETSAKSKDLLVYLIQAAKRIIIALAAPQLQRMTKIEEKDLPRLIVAAYQWVSSLKTVHSSDMVDKNDFVTKTLHSPIFDYFWEMHQRGSKPLSNPTDDEKILAVYGRTAEHLQSKGSIYTDLTIVEPAKPLTTEYEKYVYRSYVQAVQYLKLGIYLQPIISEDGEGLLIREQFAASFADVRDYEAFMVWKRTMFHVSLVCYPATRPSIRKAAAAYSEHAAYRTINLAKFYKEDGAPAVWKHYQYSLGGKKVILSHAEVLEKTRSGEIRKYQFVDWSDGKVAISALKNSSVEVAVLTKLSIICLMSYYQFRCPEGDVHEFNRDGECRKCSLGKLNKLAYYNKYRKSFADLRAETAQKNNIIVAGMNHRYPIPMPAKVSPWKEKTDIIVAWCELSSTSFILYNSMGLMWRCQEKDVVADKFDAFKDITDVDYTLRLAYLTNYYYLIYRMYTRIRNDKDAHIMSPEVATFLRKYSSTLGNSPYQEFNITLFDTQIVAEKSAAVACNFVLSCICNALTQIYNIKNYGRDLAKLLNATILAQDRGTTIPAVLIGKQREKPQLSLSYDPEEEELDESLEDMDEKKTDEPEITNKAKVQDENLPEEENTSDSEIALEDLDIEESNRGGDDDDDYPE